MSNLWYILTATRKTDELMLILFITAGMGAYYSAKTSIQQAAALLLRYSSFLHASQPSPAGGKGPRGRHLARFRKTG